MKERNQIETNNEYEKMMNDILNLEKQLNIYKKEKKTRTVARDFDKNAGKITNRNNKLS